MVVLFISAALVVASIVYSVVHTKKAGQELANIIAEKDSVSSALRVYIKKIESDRDADLAYIKTLRSELQSCTDKAKAKAKAAKTATVSAEPHEKKAPVLQEKSKRSYTKKSK
jgi:hypothetical protein